MSYCSSCGSQSSLDAQFCCSCGTRLIPQQAMNQRHGGSPATISRRTGIVILVGLFLLIVVAFASDNTQKLSDADREKIYKLQKGTLDALCERMPQLKGCPGNP